jgi:ADP-ribose pyrophosphatase YjhB (NUDIX family)
MENNTYKTEYVLGFMFSESGENVALIKKNKPEWQAGCYNGVGGKVAPLEGQWDTMAREFKEETLVDTEPSDWIFYAVLEGEKFKVLVFYTFSDKVWDVKTATKEPVDVFKVQEVTTLRTITNLQWLIPMALAAKKDRWFLHAAARYM